MRCFSGLTTCRCDSTLRFSCQSATAETRSVPFWPKHSGRTRILRRIQLVDVVRAATLSSTFGTLFVPKTRRLGVFRNWTSHPSASIVRMCVQNALSRRNQTSDRSNVHRVKSGMHGNDTPCSARPFNTAHVHRVKRGDANRPQYTHSGLITPKVGSPKNLS